MLCNSSARFKFARAQLERLWRAEMIQESGGRLKPSTAEVKSQCATNEDTAEPMHLGLAGEQSG
jgi:hypothetical protein